MSTPMLVEIFEYNAFTGEPFAGNPAGVVLNASRLDAATMQRIARQMNLAETAFLVPSKSPAADVRLRWFTPMKEVDLCGHATIAAFSAAAERGLFPVGQGETRELKVETRSGLLRIRITRSGDAPRVAMQIPSPDFAELAIDRDAFAAVWGVGASDLHGTWRVLQGLNYWYLPVRDHGSLAALALKAKDLARFDDSAAFAFYTHETVDADSDWHLRFFAPFHGVDEDVVTGSAQGPMGVVHLLDRGIEPSDGWTELKGEQGDLLGRPGRVGVRVLHEAGKVTDLEILGGAIAMLEGKIRSGA
ncbi:MAG: PhzF family phenazine biosynthesis protein [Gemmatimonadales bacterium]|jgi:PhzF family phenazine biosynthesis protein